MNWRGLVLSAVMVSLAVGIAADPKPDVVPFGKLSAKVPSTWKVEKPSNRLRSHQFRLPAGMPDLADAEVIVMPDSNPDPAKSFPRWKESFMPPEGKTADDISTVSKSEIAGLTVNTLDVTGTWKFKERPFDPKSKEELRPDYRVIWVIVASKDEATHVRLSGPAVVVKKWYPEFETWLKSAK